MIVTQSLVLIGFMLLLFGAAVKEMAHGEPNSGPVIIAGGFGVWFLAAVLYAALLP